MGCIQFFIILLVISIVVAAAPYLLIAVAALLIIYLIAKSKPIEAWNKFRLKRFEKKYYLSEEFRSLRKRVEKYIDNCNNLNRHISELKLVHLGTNQTERGKSTYYDISSYNYSRPEYEKHSQSSWVYNCSRTICDNARMQPFKYVCKYFDIKSTEESLELFESMLNNFEAAKDGVLILEREKNRILNGITNEVPPIIKKYGYDKFQYNLGFRIIGFDNITYPQYTFQYVSPGGNASTRCDVVMDIDNLNRFIHYLSENIKFRKSIAGQRALMTSTLRKKILARDNRTCKICGNSTQNEPNLLMEIDHIIPLSKGGLTTEENLQTLCWRCNRTKGAKIFN